MRSNRPHSLQRRGLLLAGALVSVLVGGQVTVLVTDFAQSVFTNVCFVVLVGFLLISVSWSSVAEVMTSTAESGLSRVNPLDTGRIEDFGFMFFVISAIQIVYGQMSWQGEQAYQASARTAHEARMGGLDEVQGKLRETLGRHGKRFGDR